ncbi:hypothetical protein [Oceaniglobus roseus]|uniref:hypothetical protein n=1 Tax=Oceaniglobus roseus TaxID=1737570 RepID=UPI000C7ED149|nr:hypothetical protein [Kandeliimicrobium roseum]
MAGLIRRTLLKGLCLAAFGLILSDFGSDLMQTRAAADLGPAPTSSQSLLRPGPAGPVLTTGDLAAPLRTASPRPKPRLETTACAAILTASPTAAALVRLALHAPCAPDMPATLHHEGLSFDLRTDAEGRWSAEVPALTPEAVFDVALAGRTLRAAASVPDAVDYARVILLADDSAPLHIHALELGAGRDSAGHVWAGTPGAPMRAVRGRGGFLVRLGDGAGGRSAEVYTFPAFDTLRRGAVRLSVEAEVDRRFCGRQVSGTILQPAADGVLSAMALAVDLPSCASGERTLVLKNLLRDLKIAAN